MRRDGAAVGEGIEPGRERAAVLDLPDLGMYYNRARYYQPGTGRFWTMDPFDGNTDDPKSLHRYTYAAAVPVNSADPSGLEIESLLDLDTSIGNITSSIATSIEKLLKGLIR